MNVLRWNVRFIKAAIALAAFAALVIGSGAGSRKERVEALADSPV